MDTFDDFEAAQGAVGEDQTLCGTLMGDGTPKYFVMPADEADETYHDAAFEVRHGRPMSEIERWALAQAKLLHGTPL